MRAIIFAVFLSIQSVYALELVPLKNVTLLDGPFLQAQQINKSYLLSLDVEKLLAPFRREAGIAYTQTYGNWESSGLDGHMGGHYVSALALLYASTRDKEVLNRLNYVINELKKCQDKNANGYLGGIPDGQKAWQEIKKGDIRADNFATNERWVPWYNLHKIFAGLRDAYVYAGNRDAKKMLVKLSAWALDITSQLSKVQMQGMLRTEQGGMNEIFVEVAQITGDKKYLVLAEAFSQQALLQPLIHQQDTLTGLHANTQIPKVIGFKRYADATHNGGWAQAADFFWQTVVKNRSVAIGGNSVREHFHDQGDFSSMVNEVEGPETCNTYNMLKLTELLYLSTDSASAKSIEYVDYYERALYNHILSSQNPSTGGFVYFTPMRPNHYRVYSQLNQGMWCCVGSGLESQSKYGEFIYASNFSQKKRPAIFINLFIPSALDLKKQRIALRQETQFPDREAVSIIIDKPANFKLLVRYPNWVREKELKMQLNGEEIVVEAKPGQYIELTRLWKKGDTLQINLAMQTHLEKMPGAANYYAILHGPIVLAAKTEPFARETLNYFADDSRMGHSPGGPSCPLEAAPFLLGNTQEFIQRLKPVAGKPLTFDASGLINDKQVEHLQLIPFFRLHESRYTIYWPYAAANELEKTRAQFAVNEQQQIELQSKTIDEVAPGEQQPESDHFYQGEMSEAGVTQGRHWRRTRGWFSYQLKDNKQQAKFLRITYAGADLGREFMILINDQLIATVRSTGDKRDYFAVDYPIPETITKSANGKLQVKFVAKAGSVAGDFYAVRLLSSAMTAVSAPEK